MTFDQIVDKLATENAASKLKHGLWAEMAEEEQFDAINEEFTEWISSYAAHDAHGDHGEIAELIDLANVCFRRIMFLTGEGAA